MRNQVGILSDIFYLLVILEIFYFYLDQVFVRPKAPRGRPKKSQIKACQESVAMNTSSNADYQTSIFKSGNQTLGKATKQTAFSLLVITLN